MRGGIGELFEFRVRTFKFLHRALDFFFVAFALGNITQRNDVVITLIGGKMADRDFKRHIATTERGCQHFDHAGAKIGQKPVRRRRRQWGMFAVGQQKPDDVAQFRITRRTAKLLRAGIKRFDAAVIRGDKNGIDGVLQNRTCAVFAAFGLRYKVSQLGGLLA